MLLGKNIQKLRNQYGFSQKELANALKLNRRTRKARAKYRNTEIIC